MTEDISPETSALDRRVRARRWFGGSAALLGATWAGTAIVPPIAEYLAGSSGLWNMVSLLAMGLAFAAPGAIVMCSGIRLIFEMRETSLKLVVGFYALLLCFLVPSLLMKAFPDALPEQVEIAGYMLSGSAIAVAAYGVSIRMLLGYFTGTVPIWRSLFSRGVLVLIGWQLWLLTSNLIDSYREAISEAAQLQDWQLSSLSLGLPLVVAYGSYRLLCTLLLPRRG